MGFSSGKSTGFPKKQVNWTGKELACALYDGLVVAEPSGLGCFEIGVSDDGC